MGRIMPYLVWLILALLVLTPAAALADGGVELSWWTVDGGGHTFSASGDGVYRLGGTIGQPNAGVMMDSSGHIILRGGFWVGRSMPFEWEVYLPLLLRY